MEKSTIGQSGASIWGGSQSGASIFCHLMSAAGNPLPTPVSILGGVSLHLCIVFFHVDNNVMQMKSI